MAVSGRAIFQAHVDGLLPESIPFDLQWTFSSAVGQIQPNVTLASGDTTITIPAGTQVIVLSPPAASAVVLKLRAAGPIDVFTLRPNMPNVFTWSSGTVTINAASQVTGVLLAFF
jgi:hypothetical protein